MAKILKVFANVLAIAVFAIVLEYLFRGHIIPKLSAFCASVLVFFMLFLGANLRRNHTPKKAGVSLNVGIALYLFILSLFNFTVRFLRTEFPLRDVDQVLMTVQMPLDGMIIPFVKDFIAEPLFLTLLFTIVLFYFVKKFYLNFKFKKIALSLAFIAVTACSITAFVRDVSVEGTKRYAEFFFTGNKTANRLVHTDFLKDYYVSPDSVVITEETSPKNLILIFLESLENDFVAYMPELQKYIESHVSYYDTDKALYGKTDVYGTGMTISAMVAKITGLPLLNSNGFIQKFSAMHNNSFFAENAGLFNVLEKFGYKNAFLQGSSGKFAGTKLFFEKHGIHSFYDPQIIGSNVTDMPDSLQSKDFAPGFSDKQLFKCGKKYFRYVNKT